MLNPISQLRASDFIILSGVAKSGKNVGRTYKFAKVDSRCALMNSNAFLEALEAEGAKAVAVV